MKLVEVYKGTGGYFNRFYMHGTVYGSHAKLIISSVTVKEFNTRYTRKDRLTKETNHEE